MRKKVIIFCLLISSFFIKAQESKIVVDSLQHVLKKGNKIEQFKALTLLSEEMCNTNLDLAFLYANKSLKQAQILKNKTCVAISYNSLANIYQYKTELDSAFYYNNKALKIRLQAKDSIRIAESYNNIGIIYDLKGQFSKSLEYYFKSLYYFEKKKNIAKQAMVISNIGIVYKAEMDYVKAYQYYKKAYELYSKTTDKFGQTSTASNLGSILINLKRYNESLHYSLIAKKGYKNLGYEPFLPYPISNMACTYDSLHQYKVAEINYLKSIQLFEKYNNNYEVSEISNLYSNCLLKQKKYSQSIDAANKALEYAKKSKAYLLEIRSYKNLFNANNGIGNYQKAIAFIKKYNTGSDSLFANEKTKAVFELETKYQTEKKEKLLLKKEVEAKQKNIVLIGITSLLALIIILAFLIYRQQKLKNKQQKQEFQLKSAIAQIETQNKLQEQRLNISRDLHDNIGAQLTFIISSVDSIKYAFEISNKKLDNKLSNISNFAKETIIELRDTIWAMNSNEITYEDLEVRINNYIDKAKEAKDQISFSITIDEELKTQKLTSVQGMNVYRTIQEAVNNAVKYANASVITINAKKLETQTKITIQDNGIGFDQVTIEKGNGLQNMQKRIEEIEGKFHLTSSNEGTKIEFFLKNSI